MRNRCLQSKKEIANYPVCHVWLLVETDGVWRAKRFQNFADSVPIMRLMESQAE